MTAAAGRGSRATLVAVFVLSVAIAAIAPVRSLVEHHGDPTTLLRVGASSISRSVVERDFDDPVLVPDYGHDGQQFYVIARAFPDLEAADGQVDRLQYRARRVLLPAIVSPLPDGAATVWGMLAVNLAAIGAAGVAVAVLARRLGASPWLGLAVAITPAMVESASGSLGDAPAFALALWGTVVWRRRPWLAAGLFLLAALSRETALVAALACLVVARERRWAPLLAPFVGFLAWAALVAVWLPASGSSAAKDASLTFNAPFVGWVQVGWGDAIVLGLALLAASLWAAWDLRSRLPELSVWLLVDAALLVVSSNAVVFRSWNFARVAPLAVPALALAAGSRFGAHSREQVPDGDGDLSAPR